MMLSGPEMVLLLIIVIVTLIFHKMPDISRGLARMRLRFDKGISEEYIEAIAEEEEEDAAE